MARKSTTARGSGPLAESTQIPTPDAGKFTVNAQARQLIRQSLADAPPDLRDLGYSSNPFYGKPVRALTGGSADEMVAMIAAVIEFFIANGRPDDRRGVNSYHLKHHVERWVWRTTGKPMYISNGAAIAAALAIRLGVERDTDPRFPNVRIGARLVGAP